MISCTEKDDPNYELLLETHKKIEEIVQTVNEIKRKRDNLEIVNKLNERIAVKGFVLVQPNRYLVYQCEEMVLTKPKKKQKMREIYVFNDIVVHLRKSKTSRNKNSIVYLQYCDIVYNKENHLSFHLANEKWKDNNYIFKVSCSNEDSLLKLTSSIEKGLQIKKKQAAFVNLGIVQVNNKNLPVKYSEIMQSNTNKDLVACSFTENDKIWLVSHPSSVDVLYVEKKLIAASFLVTKDRTSVTSLASDSHFIFFSMENGEILVFDNKTHKIECQSPQFHSSKINSLHFLQKENFFVSSDESGVLCFWKFEENAFHLLKKLEIGGNLSLVYPFVERDCTNILVSSFDNENKKSNLFKIEDPSNFERLEAIKVLSLDGITHSLCFVGGRIWIGIEKDIAVYDYSSFKQLSLIKNPHKRTRAVSISSTDENIVVSFGQDSSIRIWKAESFESLKIVEIHNDQIIQTITKENHIYSITKKSEIYKFNFQN